MSAAAALARAEAAGVRLRLRPDGGVRMEAAAPPPADVLAALRRWREDVARLLAAREAQPERVEAPWPAVADFHLTRDAARLSGLIAAGCEWRRCPAGGLDVTLQDGRLLLVSPATVARLRAAGLLPPELADHDEAERLAMAAHYAAPPEGAGAYRPGDPDPYRDALLALARVMPGNPSR